MASKGKKHGMFATNVAVPEALRCFSRILRGVFGKIHIMAGDTAKW